MNADVPWAMAGPSGADPAARHYSHDAWNSISATIKLPVKGAVMGALAPVLTPSEPGERRCVVVAFPIISASAADRQSASSEWAADMGEGLRTKAKVKPRTKAVDEAAKVRGLDRKLARGSSLTRPYAVATVTVPKTVAGRRVRSPPGRLRPPGRVRAAAPGPQPGRRVRRVHDPARGQPDPNRGRVMPPAAPGVTSPACSPTSATTCPQPQPGPVPVREPRLFRHASRRGPARPGGAGRPRRGRRCRCGG